ncbi:MAG: hypothetical protein JO001_11415 [Alphaproteobacteria bacterium]|nr:hypothetical protein [Alphaproteobacteria bacterium]
MRSAPGLAIITIETRNYEVDATGATSLGDLAPGPFIMLAVSDNGAGMSLETRARAIEPFFTTNEIGRGSGLGLSQVYGFARQSGGQLEIDSAVGRGTTMRIFLPDSLRKDGAREAKGEPYYSRRTTTMFSP